MIIQVGVKIIIHDDEGRYLFLRRAASYKDGQQPWDIPGGRIEPDESLEDALAREVFEETHMKLGENFRLIAAQDIFVPAKDLHVVRLTYSGTAEGKVVISDEHSEFRWMSNAQVCSERLDSYIANIDDKLW